MATKLRKFSYSIFVKVIIFLLTAGCIAMAGRALFKVMIADALFYRTYGVNYNYVEDFKSSSSFAEMVSGDVEKIQVYMELYHGDEEYVKSGKAWADHEAQLRAGSEKNTQDEITEKVQYYMTQYGSPDAELYSEVNLDNTENNPDLETTTVNASQNDNTANIYTLENAKKVLDDYYYGLLENEVDYIRSNAEKNLENNINSEKQDFLNKYEELKNKIESLENFQFIYDNGTYFLTNIDGVEKREDRNYTGDVSNVPFAVSSDGMVINHANIPSYISSSIADCCYAMGGNITFGINTDFFPNDKYYKASQDYALNYEQLNDSIYTGAICAFGAVMGIIYLMIIAGRKDKNSPVEEAAIDRCFHDLHFIITGALIFFAGLYTYVFYSSSMWEEIEKLNESNALGYNGVSAINTNLFTAVTFVCAVLLLEWFMSFVRSVKLRTLIKHSLWYVTVRKIAHFFKKCANKIKSELDLGYHFNCLKKSVLWKMILFFAANAVFFLLGFIGFDSGEFGILLFLCLIPASVFNIIFFIKNFETIKNLDKIFTEIKKGSQGDFNFSLDYSKMKEPVKGFARDVENMQNGLKTAVNEAIKGERMKTELITNVSHDLKTPLTSIINYVDLLGRCDITDETAKEYIGVLSDKSEKLKKLIEDLVEASKASTGNIKITKIKMNLYELAVQAVGEHEDALEERGIEVRINTPEKQPVVLADNQKTWRIIDNLFSNVKKYSLKGTRAYITVDEKDGWGRFSIKNVSEKALDISPDELTQRFVRGDASRSTEGSGLGLSIAKSLCELQGGRFTIEIDGDLFKATLELPLVSEDEETNKKSLLEQETAARYSSQNVNLKASFNLPPDLKVSEQMAEELRRRQIDASHNFTPPTDNNNK